MKRNIFLIVFLMMFISASQALVPSDPAAEVEEIAPIPEGDKIAEIITQKNVFVERFLTKAREYLNKGKGNEAVEVYREAIVFAPYDYRPYFHLARLYLQLDMFNDALKTLEKAGHAQAHGDLIYGKLGEIFKGLYISEEYEPQKSEKTFIAQFKDNKQSAVSFLFDDGSQITYEKILPVFEEFGYRATIPINPGFIPEVSNSASPGSWDEWRDAANRGFEIANHSLTHRRLPRLSGDELDRQVNEGYDIIKKRLGQAPLSFAFPFDDANMESIQKVLERHYAIRDHDYLASVYRKVFIPVYGGKSFSVETANNIVEMALQNRLWLVVECHTLETYTIKTFKSVTEEFLRAHLSFIKEHEESLWVDTFINIYRYLAEKQAARLSIKETGDSSLSFNITHSLDPKVFSFPLTVIINAAPAFPTSVSAAQGDANTPLDAEIIGDRISVNVVPGQGVVHVEWK